MKEIEDKNNLYPFDVFNWISLQFFEKFLNIELEINKKKEHCYTNSFNYWKNVWKQINIDFDNILERNQLLNQIDEVGLYYSFPNDILDFLKNNSNPSERSLKDKIFDNQIKNKGENLEIQKGQKKILKKQKKIGLDKTNSRSDEKNLNYNSKNTSESQNKELQAIKNAKKQKILRKVRRILMKSIYLIE